MAKKTHEKFKNIAESLGATIDVYLIGRRKVSVAFFRLKNGLVLKVNFVLGEVVSIDQSNEGRWGSVTWSPEEFHANLALMEKVKYFLEEIKK